MRSRLQTSDGYVTTDVGRTGSISLPSPQIAGAGGNGVYVLWGSNCWWWRYCEASGQSTLLPEEFRDWREEYSVVNNGSDFVLYHLLVMLMLFQAWASTVLILLGSRKHTKYIREYIQKFPDWVDNKMNNNNKHSLRSNTKGYGGITY
jgi:hypothetical protein